MERYGDQFKAESLGYEEVSVITRDRAQPLTIPDQSPRLGRLDLTEDQGTGKCIIHQLQAGVIADSYKFRIDSEDLAEKLSGLLKAERNTIVTAISAIFRLQILCIQKSRHIVSKIQLIRARLTSGHIQSQITGFELVIAHFQDLERVLKL